MAFRVRLTGGWLSAALICAAQICAAQICAATWALADDLPVLMPLLPPDAATSPPTIAKPVEAPISRALPYVYATPALAPVRPRKKIASPPPLETALSSDPTPTLTPETAAATARAADRYAGIAASGGWPTDIAPLPLRAKGPEVAELRRRLAIEGDLDRAAAEGASAEVWDGELTQAVKRFQSRLGLRPSGYVSVATAKALDVPASERANQLAASAGRLADLSFTFGERYVVVNLPATAVEAVENGKVVHRYAAIVGDVDHPSPEIAAHVFAINLNPTWTVPVSIIKKEIIPRMQRDPGYLTREKIRILDGHGDEIDPRSINWATERATYYTLRQDSGAGNSLGSIRIDMPNTQAVYMHDTPSKGLFGADYRFLSHGCVRVQGVYDLAAWLLEGTSGAPTGGAWDKEALLEEIKTGVSEALRVMKPTPVIWVYLTGWANGEGAANFRNDVYGLDAANRGGSLAPLAEGAQPAPAATTAQ
jgi:murein L,D-transpeptidase YcbB/YkuD